MKTLSDSKLTKDTPFQGRACSGFLMISVSVLLLAAGIALIILSEVNKAELGSSIYNTLCIFAVLLLIIFFWVNPFYSKKKVSLRARNINVDPIKVNDRNGNPILVGLILVWKVEDVYKAIFEIDTQNIAAGNTGIMTALESFVRVQSDAALRQVAGNYAYDNLGMEEADTITLRSGGDTINSELVEKLNERLEMAGISVLEARINYLAYAPEIAAVMLRRQQAEAIISAREKIVEGAVSMVQMALKEINDKDIVELDEAKKAAMVSNLLVVLCADEAAQPVLNTGSLYQ